RAPEGAPRRRGEARGREVVVDRGHARSRRPLPEGHAPARHGGRAPAMSAERAGGSSGGAEVGAAASGGAGETPGVRRLLLAIYAPTVITSLCDGVLTPTLPLFMASFETSLALVGLALAGEAIGMLIGDVPAGWFVDRTSPKAALLLGGALTLASVLA